MSLTCGDDSSPDTNSFDAIEKLDGLILANDAHAIWGCVSAGAKARIDIILDNAGFELFTDLVLADFLLRYDFAGKVRFHVKAIPWFISDVTESDFMRIIERLTANGSPEIRDFGIRIRTYYEKQQIELSPLERFWTSPYEFDAMERQAPNLYADLSQSHLLIFKGDLNYRKLLGDINWQSSTSFLDALQSFRPTNLCTLRTIKADLICGVPAVTCQKLSEQNDKWMETGDNAVIQFAPKP